MSNKLPSFSAVAIAFVATSFHAAFGQAPAAPVQAVLSAGTKGTTVARSYSGDDLVAHAIARISATDGMTAQVRLSADLFGNQMVGSGYYWQIATEPPMFRLDVKLQGSSFAATMQQVADGEQLWIRYDVPNTKSLVRINLRQVMAEERSRSAAAAAVAGGAMRWTSLTQSLKGLAGGFSFVNHGLYTVDGATVYALEGRWRPEVLAVLLPEQRAALGAGQAADLSKLAEHLPDEVVLLLRADTLFPFRIQYRRTTAASSLLARGLVTRNLLEVEYHDVVPNAAIDPSIFRFEPGDQPFADLTDATIAALPK